LLPVVGVGGYLAWQLFKPGLRPVHQRPAIMTDLLRSQTEGYRVVDAWAAPISPQESDDAGEWAWACVSAMPGPAILLTARNTLVRLFGGVPVTGRNTVGGEIHRAFVSHTDRNPEPGNTSPEDERMGWISLHGDHEVVVGMDDKHLDFRLGLSTFDGQISITTLFQPHNWIGQAYWSIVRLFHRHIVRAMLRQARVPEKGKSSLPEADVH
jgi:hypothetical protein